MLAKPEPFPSASEPVVIVLFIATEFVPTEPVPEIVNVSPETMFPNVVISELRTFVVASYALMPSRLITLCVTFIFAVLSV